MKKITVDEVARILADLDSMEQEGSTATYFLYITDAGEIVSDRRDADESFTATMSVEGLEGDWREEVETLDNEAFREVCKDLADQANDYLETWGED